MQYAAVIFNCYYSTSSCLHCFTKSLQCEWNYLQRVVPDCDSLFTDLEHALVNKFLPTLLGSNVTPRERLLFSLPVCMGRLDVRDPVMSASNAYQASRNAALLLVEAIKGKEVFVSETHNDSVRSSKMASKKQSKKEPSRSLHMFSTSVIIFNQDQF